MFHEFTEAAGDRSAYDQNTEVKGSINATSLCRDIRCHLAGNQGSDMDDPLVAFVRLYSREVKRYAHFRFSNTHSGIKQVNSFLSYCIVRPARLRHASYAWNVYSPVSSLPHGVQRRHGMF